MDQSVLEPNRCKAREKMQPVSSAGKDVTGVKRRERCNRCQARVKLCRQVIKWFVFFYILIGQKKKERNSFIFQYWSVVLNELFWSTAAPPVARRPSVSSSQDDQLQEIYFNFLRKTWNLLHCGRLRQVLVTFERSFNCTKIWQTL